MSASILVAGVHTSLVALSSHPVTAISAALINRIASNRRNDLFALTINGGPQGSFTTVLECCVQQNLELDVYLGSDWTSSVREWLIGGQVAHDRPDLVSRVFYIKKQAIIDDIYKNGVFGRAAAYVYTIEFQKRGLPHIHILIFLEPGYKLLTLEDIDSAIWARWPDPDTQPLLFEAIKTCMVHGPCGTANPLAPCMENGKCTKRYPKPFQDETNMDEEGYPKYFRPNDGRAYDVGGFQVDNSWIIPYSPYFSAKYNCHTNVECAVSLSSFKYVFKYIQKGGDLEGIEVNRRDEITRWIEGGYISASEAYYILTCTTKYLIPATFR